MAAAAEQWAADLFSDHPAADVLTQVALALARDVDYAEETRDRVAASKELRAVVADLTAVASGGEEDDDFLDLGGVPPGVGDQATG